jgi:HSP20 family protein
MATTTLARRSDPFARLGDWFALPELFRPFERPLMDEMIRVEETMNDDHLTIKAEMPGIDPAKDVEIELADGFLTISAERREEEKSEEAGRTVSEFRYGSFRRTLRVPKDAKPEDVTALYKDGILTISVPIPKVTKPEVTKVAVTRG